MREMKDSGIEWIGEIPKDWCVKNGKYVFNVYGMSVNDDFINDTDEESYKIKYYKVDNLNEATEQFYIKSNFANFGIKIYEIKGPIILVPKRGGAIYTNKVRIEKEACLFDSNIMGLTTNNNVRFMAYVLYGRGLSDIGDVTTIPQINKKHIDVLKIPVPSINEQKVIVDYLDTQCSEIDATAEDIQKEISLLEEYKKSVITEAVTKGLNPDAEMKDSGIEWIGEIPKDWEIIKGKYVLEYLQKPIKDDDGVITCFRDGEVTLRSNRREDGFTLSDKEIGYQGIDVGDLVVHGMDGFAGAIGISDSRGKASPVLNVLNSKYNKRYLMYYLRSMAFSNIFVALASGIRVRSCDLRWNKLAELPYPTTNYAEQTEIVNYIDTKCSEIDTLISDKKRQLDILADYKKSLIYEYVTGKKEVPVNE